MACSQVCAVTRPYNCYHVVSASFAVITSISTSVCTHKFMSAIAVMVQGQHSVEGALAKFTRPETLSLDNAYMCERYVHLTVYYSNWCRYIHVVANCIHLHHI